MKNHFWTSSTTYFKIQKTERWMKIKISSRGSSISWETSIMTPPWGIGCLVKVNSNFVSSAILYKLLCCICSNKYPRLLSFFLVLIVFFFSITSVNMKRVYDDSFIISTLNVIACVSRALMKNGIPEAPRAGLRRIAPATLPLVIIVILPGGPWADDLRRGRCRDRRVWHRPACPARPRGPAARRIGAWFCCSIRVFSCSPAPFCRTAVPSISRWKFSLWKSH